MTIHELNFISYLFNDGEIQTVFNEKLNTITFIDEEYNAYNIEYPGNMRDLLIKLSSLRFPDTTALCNIPKAAKAALYYIK